MRYGVVFLRSSRFRLRHVKIGNNVVKLSIPPGEEQVMDSELKNIFYNDCYGLMQVDRVTESVLDIGGNLGFFSMAARSRFPGARIHSYEPNPQIQHHLLHNTSGLSIDVFPEAIGACGGKINLKMHGGSLYSTTESSESGNIKRTAIANAIDRIGGSVDLLKLDCEGAEWELFQHQEIWKHVNRLTMEYHLWANPEVGVPEMVKIVRDLGFRITQLSESKELKWGILHAARFRP